jgi:hypothetical protein
MVFPGEFAAAEAHARRQACGRKRGAMGPGGAVSVHPRPPDGPATHHAPRGRRPACAHGPLPRIGVVCGEPGRCLIARMWDLGDVETVRERTMRDALLSLSFARVGDDARVEICRFVA